MTSTTLNALEKLETAGFNRDQATAIVATFEQADSEQAAILATKADLQSGLADLRADLYRALFGFWGVPLWPPPPVASMLLCRWFPGS